MVGQCVKLFRCARQARAFCKTPPRGATAVFAQNLTALFNTEKLLSYVKYQANVLLGLLEKFCARQTGF